MNNPLRILTVLDSHLHHPLELNIYGRSAIALGFHPQPPFSATMDIDLILPEIEVEAMDINTDFWGAVEATNDELAEEGLYLTHIFIDRQLIIRPNWIQHRAALEIDGLSHIRPFRPSTVDLLLTKCMRVDPQDRDDIRFLSQETHLTQEEWKAVFAEAQLPEIEEISEAFVQNQNWFFKEVLS